MIDDLRSRIDLACEGCDRELDDEPAIVFRTAGGERRAYECPCGAVTITVVKGEPSV
ncbi:MAG: hypothetical protein ABEH35_00695 [Haloarculaceae archaeon]